MDFEDDARLDASQVEDARGSGFPGGGLAIGGGAVGIVGLVLALLLGVDITGGGGGGPERQAQPAGNLSAQCRTGNDADQSEDCRVVGVVNSIQRYWSEVFERDGRDYVPARTRLFSQATRTACGHATSDVGPFYCPGDQKVYLDLTFFGQLQRDFGAEGGPFAQAYVIAHEYGHHVQNLLGATEKAQADPKGATSGSVRLELQADCYAGVWAKHAVDTGFYSKPFTDADIRQAIDAAEAVGDDRIQERAQGRVDPDSFTHGTSAQRHRWFATGYQTGDPNACDTFSGSI
ncbi:KPN_02809 family neutral zinc metallopeptidase [Thermomonospora cellulosilytica]|uniref:Putative metalloprotease n=1 Tax=Thermomonospora cellulosilytica TaxID=1411118 RepID=A0A7W3N0M3_9ACTN|nr:neutral zinc metallopeptidase [Thermomonospora cellulosilytica]MBA9005272.1 putative metalloprotease [Thermomonospora cellulosilytica]